jgi:hypothetical protein
VSELQILQTPIRFNGDVACLCLSSLVNKMVAVKDELNIVAMPLALSN